MDSSLYYTDPINEEKHNAPSDDNSQSLTSPTALWVLKLTTYTLQLQVMMQQLEPHTDISNLLFFVYTPKKEVGTELRPS